MLGIPAYQSRILGELQLLERDGPAEGIQCLNRDVFALDQTSPLLIEIEGPSKSPYSGHRYTLAIQFPAHPPGSSPYHPNVDREGRICLDLLKLPPAGTWRPTITLISVITALRVLLVEPNPDDPLIPEIAREYICNRDLYWEKAKRGDYNQNMAITPNTFEGDDGKSSLLMSRKRQKQKTPPT